jgi:DNA-directed RNA polymerase subunit alpha
MKNFNIKCIKEEINNSGSMYGQFLLNSLNSSQGLTIGNLLRRTLLGDLSGTAINAVKINNGVYELSNLEGVREDILEVLLNIKGIVIKNIDNISIFDSGKLKVEGPAVVTANMIKMPLGLEVVNPNHYIASLVENRILEIEFLFNKSTNYKLVTQASEKGLLYIDAIYMPVIKVDFKVNKNAYYSKDKSELLLLDIWTNGSISPKEALTDSIELIRDLFNNFLNSNIKNELIKIDGYNFNDIYQNITIEELNLSSNVYTFLKEKRINTISDIIILFIEQVCVIPKKARQEILIKLKNEIGIILD